MTQQQKLFVVVDPTADQHIALERAIIISTLRAEKPFVYVFVAVDPEATDTRATNDYVFRDQSWFVDKIRQPLENAGLDYLIEVSAKTTSRFTFTESKWALLKGAHCPVVLIRPDALAQRKVIIAAVNFQAQRDVQRELNRKILEQAKFYADAYGADLHLINGYLDSMTYPDRGRLVNETGMPVDRIHVKPGYTSDVVSALAEEIDADLVIMGTLGQNGMTTTRRGNTAERLIAALDCDVMVINHE
jgi:universal stress protein E